MRNNTEPTPGTGEQRAPSQKRQFVLFSFYKVDPAWRRLPVEERRSGKEAFTQVVGDYCSQGVLVNSYSTVGTRADTELMLWRIGYDLEKLQEMSGKLLATGLGNYLATTHSYLAVAKRSTYVDKLDPDHQESRSVIVPGRMKYLFVYPFVKKREWYLMSQAARQGVMDEHIQVGSKYMSVKLNTTYSFGLDDQEFVVAFETDEPVDFLDLVMELRETEGSRYTERDTPIFTCIRRDLPAALDLLGG